MAIRCKWAEGDALMSAYHDAEWGVPVRDGRMLWEMLQLEGFQAGLSGARSCIDAKDSARPLPASIPKRSRASTPADVERLMGDAGIIRARAKIEATIGNARAFLAMRDAGEDFCRFRLGPSSAARRSSTTAITVPASTPLSEADLEGAQEARLQVRRSRDRLCLDAGGGARQRPCTRLFPAKRGGRQPGMTRSQAHKADCPDTATFPTFPHRTRMQKSGLSGHTDIADIVINGHDGYASGMRRSLATRLGIAFVSSGWIAPLCLSFAWSQGFLWKTYGIVVGSAWPDPWHPFSLAAPTFYIAMAWLFIVIVVRVLHLTKEH